MDTKSVELFPSSREVAVSTTAAPEVARPVVDVIDVAASSVEGDKPASAIPEEEIERMTADIIAALKTVYDPEIPSDVYELGLIYRIDIEDDKTVVVDMTLTSPGCPVAGEMPGWVQNAVNSVGGVRETKVNLVFDPPWHQGRMSDEARLALNMF
jgi:FeS assembly SUF system protein